MQFEVLNALNPVSRATVIAELKLIAKTIRYWRNTRRYADDRCNKEIKKQENIAYGFSQALAMTLGISWFTVGDEIDVIWNFAKYATEASKADPVRPVAQTYYARRKVADKVRRDIIDELWEEYKRDLSQAKADHETTE